MKRPIAIGLSPNVTSIDAFAAFAYLVQPWKYKKGKATAQLEGWFEKYFSFPTAVSFTSGRGALFAILKNLDIQKGDEVILQAFTCAAVVQAIISVGATPIFADIDETLTLSPQSVEQHISKRTKAIIVQYTFGIPAEVEKLQKIAKKHTIYLIEDVAHTIGATDNGKKLGTFGIASIFSFGRDKAFSSVNGGMAITSDKKLGERLVKFQKNKMYPSTWWITQSLLHPVVFYFLILPTYNFLKIGKGVLFVLQKMHILSVPVDKRKNTISEEDVKKLPNALSTLVLLQLQRLDKVNKRREEIAKIYKNELQEFSQPVKNISTPFLRYPILIENAESYLKYLRKKGIYVGNWYSNVIDPKGVVFSTLQYNVGSCPHAEKIAKQVLNLPTYASLSDKDVYTIIKALQTYATRQRNNK